MRNYLAIGGCPRSGTTALTDFLNMDDRIFIGREFKIFDHWDKPITLGGIIDERFKKSRDKLLKVKRYGINPPQIGQTGKSYMDYVESVREFDIYGDKMPRSYIYHAADMAKQFPSMKFIFCLRDGRDVVASMLRLWNKGVRKGFTFGNPIEAQRFWVRQVKHMEGALFGFRKRTFLAKYEEMVMDPEGSSEKLGRFLGLGKINISNHNYHPVHMGAWKDELPDMPMCEEFKTMLNKWGYK